MAPGGLSRASARNAVQVQVAALRQHRHTHYALWREVDMPVTNTFSAAVRGQLYDQTSTFFSPTNDTITPGTELPGYAVTNFTVSLEDKKAGWWAGVIIKN